MKSIYLVHIIAGTLGLVSGFLALFTAKGSTLHRRSGTLLIVLSTMLYWLWCISIKRSLRGVVETVDRSTTVVA